MYIRQVYTDCLAQASYYLESDGEVIIIDPIRDTAPYLDLLSSRNAKLKYIFETHFHADFISGHLALSRLTNAEIVFGPGAETGYEIISCKDNDEFTFGKLKLRALHTPGHTLESVCYLLLSDDDYPEAVFTGDTLFVGEVGRPDLAVNSHLKSSDLAKLLYDSLHNVLLTLPDHVTVYPGHGAGSACGKNISNETTSTIGEQKNNNYALQKMSKENFVSMILDGIPEAPAYFKHDVTLNKEGYISISKVLQTSLKKLSSIDVQKGIDRGCVLLDVRMPNDFEKGFIPSSINIGKTGMFAPWVGTLIVPKSEIIIICYPEEEEEVISRLARVGYENIIGYTYGVNDWLFSGNKIDMIESLNPQENLFVNTSINVLDVRKKNELSVGYVKDSLHIPLSQIQKKLVELNQSEEYLIYCAGGYRSMIAASILKANGYKKIKNIYGGYRSIHQMRLNN
ncbi:MAG: MBL fold metallo-hydrolase [Flavobacteriales bacterium]|nr:MBL fold metallo-hydrolase [Flavobacteriales bacterium]|tara:strand:- start:1823 stop:3184 length:1362 start_codon:yes stop_codon:yes gene_type:complete